jgi:hypothetical protein
LMQYILFPAASEERLQFTFPRRPASYSVTILQITTQPQPYHQPLFIERSLTKLNGLHIQHGISYSERIH